MGLKLVGSRLELLPPLSPRENSADAPANRMSTILPEACMLAYGKYIV